MLNTAVNSLITSGTHFLSINTKASYQLELQKFFSLLSFLIYNKTPANVYRNQRSQFSFFR